MSDYSLNDSVYYGNLVNIPSLRIYGKEYENISVINLFLHAESFNYHIYEMFKNKEFIGLFMLFSDFKLHWPIHERKFNWEVCSVGNSIGEFVEINHNILKLLLESDGRKLQTYILQRALWPNDASIIAKHKRIEFELCRLIINGLGDTVNFTQQAQILEYKADVLFMLKHTSLTCIPTFILEIDEDDHKDRDKSREKERQSVLEFYTNRVIRVPVSRSSNDEKLKEIANKTIVKIKNMINELVAQYTTEISPEFFMAKVDKYNIEKQFITWFYKPSENNSNFKYDHESVGGFLGYAAGKDGKYKFLKKLICDNLDINEDYIEILRGENNLPPQNQGKKSNMARSQGKKFIIMTCLGFFKLCMVARECRVAFAKIYELALEFAMTMKARIIYDMKTIEEKKDYAAGKDGKY
jgi:hypothetical protein